MHVYQDIIQRLTRYIGGNKKDASSAEIRDAIQDALRDVVDGYHWQSLQATYMLALSAPVTLTLSYDHTGGSSERIWTVTSGTLPSWSNYGTLRVGNNDWPIQRQLDSTTLQSPVEVNPGADIASTSNVQFYRDSYTLRPEVLRVGAVYPETAVIAQNEVYSQLQGLRRIQGSSGSVYRTTVIRDRHLPHRLALQAYPWPDTAEYMEFPIYRRPRELKYTGFAKRDRTGTVTISSGSTTVTGTGTLFESGMEGAILRVSSNSVDYPTDSSGPNPAALEAVIDQQSSTTALTLLSNDTSTTFTDVKYTISDPVDIPNLMMNAFLRCCEKHLEFNRNRDQQGRNQAVNLYQDALMDAKYADGKLSFQSTSFLDYVPSVEELESWREVGEAV